ncbi:MAG: hypothetical protein RSE32_14315 [Comamonas sp.]|uniref:hypothetical protein n=1 Tax=Comamonas sp. TaxID=34028 RepID=UPI002FC784EC
MSTDIEARLREYYATTPPAVRPVGVLVISHSALARRFVFWPEPYAGQVVSEEYGVLDVQYAPMMLDRAGSEANLDQEYRITLDTTDVQDDFRDQLDAIPLNTSERIRIDILTYLSDDLTAQQESATLQAETVSWVVGTATITAVVPRYNVLSTGELYEPGVVPMLRAFY